MITTLIITVAFCLGWRIVTDEGNLLYFIRKPFESIQENVEMNEELYAAFKNPEVLKRLKVLRLKMYFAKPFVLCITCFGSIWGALVYLSLTDTIVISHLIINSISASFIQTYIWIAFEKLRQ